MWKNIGLEQCQSFINCQLQPRASHTEDQVHPSITISRLTGAGGRSVASELAEYLQAHIPGHHPWTVFDRNLMDKVLQDHHLSRRVAEFEPEDHKSYMREAFEETLGLHPSTWTIVQQTAETILKLARAGWVIVVGRGATVVTANLAQTFHLRLVGSVEQRARRVQEVYHLDPQAALEFLKKEDKGRRRYLKDHYHKDIEDPLLYDLVLNTDRITYADAARWVGEMIIHRLHLERPEVAMMV